jgi:hypothetical protein
MKNNYIFREARPEFFNIIKLNFVVYCLEDYHILFLRVFCSAIYRKIKQCLFALNCVHLDANTSIKVKVKFIQL